MYFLFHNQILSKVLSMGVLQSTLTNYFHATADVTTLIHKLYSVFSLLIQLFMS